MSNKNENSVLLDSLNQLIDEISKANSFNLPDHDYSFNKDVLVNSGFLRIQNGSIHVIESHDFTEAIYHRYKSKFNFKRANCFQDYVDFFENVKLDFLGKSHYVQGSLDHFRNLLSSLIIRANKGYGESFEAFVLNKTKEDEFIYEFSVSFSRSLQHLAIPNKSLFQILKHLYSEFEDKEATYNMNTGELTNGVRLYCESRFAKGKLLLSSFLKARSNQYSNYIIAILTGLYNHDPIWGYSKLKLLSRSTFHQVSIICAIAVVNRKTEQEGDQLLELVDNIDSSDVTFLINKPKVYCRFLSEQNQRRNNICKNRLIELISKKEVIIKHHVLNELWFTKGFDDVIFEIITHLTKDEIPNELSSLISNVLANFSKTDFFFDFMLKFAEKNQFKFEAEAFSSAIHKLRSEHRSVFSERLISLLIHDEGFVRDIGEKIISKFSYRIDQNYFLFDFDILQLSAINQYKLWISLLQNPHEPKRFLPAIFSLRNSKFSFVQEAFICRVEDLIEDYAYSVIEVYKSIMDSKSQTDIDLLQRLELRFEKTASKWDERDKLKELDPRYTQSKLYKIYMEQFTNSINDSMEGVMEGREGSLLSLLATTINLAKGGGLKHSEKDEISQLGTIGTAMQFPNSYYKSPDAFNWQRMTDKHENWSKLLEGWEAIISS